MRRQLVTSAARASPMALLSRVEAFGARTAVVDVDGTTSTYAHLAARSRQLAGAALRASGASGPGALGGERVAFLCSPGSDYVAAQWAAWRLGGCAVPLCVSHPKAEMLHVVKDCGARVLFADAESEAKAQALVAEVPHLRLVSTSAGRTAGSAEPGPEAAGEPFEDALASDGASVSPDAPAMLVYTSGTTGAPKGVVTRHSALEAQISDQLAAWGWRSDDRAVNCLPLHHVHGVVNLLCVPLSCGACVEFSPAAPEALWARLGRRAPDPVSVFMAVPTIYARLLQALEAMPPEQRDAVAARAAQARLMVSGSAALPSSVMERWRLATGHTLLERYGMTEFGMALSNPLEPVEGRLPGYVGTPMPSAQVKIVDAESGSDSGRAVRPGEAGMLLVRGPIVFREYWGRPEATAAEFDEDGWFRTGDVAAFDEEVQAYRILGRASADIIKTGGYKVSALEVERGLLESDAVREVAVLGVPDPEGVFGEVVAAVVVLAPGHTAASARLSEVASEHLAPYKAPRKYLYLDAEIPKNAMGKVNKKQLRASLFPPESESTE